MPANDAFSPGKSAKNADFVWLFDEQLQTSFFKFLANVPAPSWSIFQAIKQVHGKQKKKKGSLKLVLRYQ